MSAAYLFHLFGRTTNSEYGEISIRLKIWNDHCILFQGEESENIHIICLHISDYL